MPALTLSVLRHGGYGDRLLFQLYSGVAENPLYKYCSEAQRAPVAALLRELIVNHADMIDAYQAATSFIARTISGQDVELIQ